MSNDKENYWVRLLIAIIIGVGVIVAAGFIL